MFCASITANQVTPPDVAQLQMQKKWLLAYERGSGSLGQTGMLPVLLVMEDNRTAGGAGSKGLICLRGG
eukprot:12902840-Prorocentrum_lima.AAC.1